MKVLERKEWVKNFSHVCTCQTCESRLEADASDLKGTPGGSDPRGDEWGPSFTITCAVCNCAINVDATKVPKYLQKLVLEGKLKSQLDR